MQSEFAHASARCGALQCTKCASAHATARHRLLDDYVYRM